MVVISISISEELLREVESLCEETGLKCRSEVFRTGVRMLLSAEREKRLSGRVDAVLTVVHEQRHEDEVSQVKHLFEDIITTQIHSHLKNSKCLDVFILSGEGERIREMVNLFKANKKIDQVRLIVP